MLKFHPWEAPANLGTSVSEVFFWIYFFIVMWQNTIFNQCEFNAVSSEAFWHQKRIREPKSVKKHIQSIVQWIYHWLIHLVHRKEWVSQATKRVCSKKGRARNEKTFGQSAGELCCAEMSKLRTWQAAYGDSINVQSNSACSFLVPSQKWLQNRLSFWELIQLGDSLWYAAGETSLHCYCSWLSVPKVGSTDQRLLSFKYDTIGGLSRRQDNETLRNWVYCFET